jgi:hypothetical protein
MSTANGGDDGERPVCHESAAERRDRSSLFRIFLGGVTGTVALSLIVFAIEPRITGRPSPFAGILGVDVRSPHGVGLIAFHAFNGSVVFPLGFAFFSGRLPGPWIVKGLIWGGILWLMAQGVIMPMAGYGFFGRDAGIPGIAASALVNLVTYGALQGMMAGLPGRKEA